MDILSPASFEDGSYVVRVDVTDELGAAAVPLTASWSLYDGAGVAVNSRDGVAIAAPSSTFYVPINGDDLAVGGIALTDKTRILVVSGTYQSAVGAGVLPFTSSAKFRIEDLP